MPNLFPYTNTHELNLDWILQVVKDFQTKYTTFDQALADALTAIAAGKTEALDEISTDLTAAVNDIEASQTAALTAIGNTKDSALADIGTALTNATDAISALNTTVQAEITTLRNTSISEITTAQGTAISAITASMNHATTIIEQLYNTLPASAQDILGRLDLLDSIITGNTMESFTWLQGGYVWPTGEATTPPTTDDTATIVSSRFMTGVGGRRIRIITDGTIQIQWLQVWRNTPPGDNPGAIFPVTYPTNFYDTVIPLDVTAFSILLSRPSGYQTPFITPADIPGHIEIQWITDFVSQRIIAPKENSTTANVAREEGEYFFLDGDLYIATDDIAVGDTIAEGTNCEKKTVGGELSELKSATIATINGTIYGARSAKSGNLLPFAEDIIDGKYYSISDGELVTSTNANYYGFILAVNPNTEYHCTFARFLCLLDANKSPIAEMQSSTTIINTGNAVYIAVSFDKTTYPVESYAISLGDKTDTANYKVELPWLFSDANIHKILPNGVRVEAQTPAANSTLVACDYSNNVKYNKSYVYMAKFTGAIGNITIYHGSGTYSSYLRITPTNIIVNTSGSEVYNDAHQLTIADYLYIFIDTDDQNGAVIRVMSNGKLATVNITDWEGWQGQIFALTESALTYHRLDILFKDSNTSIWVFGDSYLSKTDNSRWAYYLKQWGVDKYMAIGYPGAGSSNIYPTLENMLSVTQPKYILWTLGMNDPDTSEAINANWLSAVNKIIPLCKKYNITLIFAKIPNANGDGTLYNHSFKNAWIEASGYRYIDVPFAVGADASGDWYTDLLATDGIHPTWRGAEAIAYQYLSDVPELMIT